MKDLICFYRISDNFQKTVDGNGNVQHKDKPSYITKENCFRNFSKVFDKCDTYVIADGCCEGTLKYVNECLEKNKENNNIKYKIFETNFGNGAASLRKAITETLLLEKQKEINSDTIIYYVEDDYLHKMLSPLLIKDGIEFSDYITLYDHPDKYVDKNTMNERRVIGNPFITDRSEMTRLYCGKFCHYKLTNSTTMTFALKLKTLKDDLSMILKYISGTFPYDFAMFRDLLSNKSRKLVSSIPGFATHGETVYLSPLTNWDDVSTTQE